MNMAEALSREVERVAILREAYRSLPDNHQPAVRPVICLMNVAIETGHLAAGSNDALSVIAAYKGLKDFEK